MSHPDYRPQKLQEYEDDWIILPINGYGDENILREILDNEKPDGVFIFTDPRFFIWLFNASDEIRDRNIPLFYWHVWDEKPVPVFNRNYYKCCDYLGCISKLTHDNVCQLGMKHKSDYIPHGVDHNVFFPMSSGELLEKKKEILGPLYDRFVVFYNSRNARRKMTSDVVKTFKYFLDEVGQDKAVLFMHTDPFDSEGANLIEVARMLGLKREQVIFSSDRIPAEQLAAFYNVADVTINISNNEGFGLSVSESLACGTPVIINKTGGLPDQAMDDEGNQFGVVIDPATESLTGSQDIPFIFDKRAADKDVVAALKKIYELSSEQRRELGLKGKAWLQKNCSLESMIDKWDKAFTKYITEFKELGCKDRVKVWEM